MRNLSTSGLRIFLIKIFFVYKFIICFSTESNYETSITVQCLDQLLGLGGFVSQIMEGENRFLKLPLIFATIQCTKIQHKKEKKQVRD